MGLKKPKTCWRNTWMVLNLRVERTLDSIPSPSLPETFDGFRFGKSSLMIEKMGNICSHLFVRYEKKVVLLNKNFTSSKKRLQNEHNRRIPNLYPRKLVLRNRISVGQSALGSWLSAWIISFYLLINIFTGSLGWNRQHHGQTIHPTKKLISMNLF